jgi:hypothetical protein
MTLTQLTKCLNDIKKTEDKLTNLFAKRDKLADNLNITRALVGQPPAETLVILNGEPTRIWRRWNGCITVETLNFN